MVTEVERLVVQLSADVKSYENSMLKAFGVTRAQLNQLKKDAANSGAATGAAFERAARGARSLGSEVRRTGTNAALFRSQVQNASFQIADFATQVAGGTSATRALAQQLPQLLGAFGVLGGVLGAGVAVGIPLVTAAFRGLGDEAVPLETRLKNVTAALEAVKRAAEVQALGIRALTERYGAADAAVQKLIASIAQLAVDEAAKAVRDLQGAFAEFTDPSFFQIAADGINEITTGTANLVRQFDLSVDQADKLREAILAFSRASGIEEAFSALVGILDVIEGARDATGQLSDEMTAFKQEVTDAADLVGQVRGAIDDVSDATGAAARAATGLAAAWGQVVQSTAAAAQMAAAAARAAGNRSAPGTFSVPTGGPSTAPGDYPLYTPPPNPADYPLFGYGAPAASAGGSGGRSGGGRAVDSEAMRARQQQIREMLQQVAREQLELERVNKQVAESFADFFISAIDGADSLKGALAGLAQQLGKLLLTRGFEALLAGGGAVRSGGLLGGRIIPGIFHGGGVAGRDGYGHGRTVSPAVFAGAHRYHGGGIAGLRPDEVPAILQRGERVLPRGSGAGGVTINQSYSFASGVDASEMRAWGERIKRDTIASIVSARRESADFLA